jgi:hypothetical protein
LVFYIGVSGFGIEVFLSNMMLSVILGLTLFLPGYIWIIGYLLTWYRRVKKSAKQDLPMPVVGYRLSRIRRKMYMAGVFACLASIAAGIGLDIFYGLPAFFLLPIATVPISVGIGLWLRRQIDIKRRRRGENIRLFIAGIAVVAVICAGGMAFTLFQMLAAFPNLPSVHSLDGRPALTLTDIGVTSPPTDADAVIRGSVAVPDHYSYVEMRIVHGEPPATVTTEVFRSVSKALTRGLYNHQLNTAHGRALAEGVYLSSDEAALWGADEGIAVVSDSSVVLLLMKDKTVIWLNLHYSDMDLESARQAVRGLLGE